MTLQTRFQVAITALAISFSLFADAQTVTNLYSFSNTNSSGGPALVVPLQGHDGRLRGTTAGTQGGAGSTFSITTTGRATQAYPFGNDGVTPGAGLTLGADGYFYGTTIFGGSSGNGVLFKLSPTGVYTVLHEFQGGTDGANPYSPPIQASDSNFYGTTLGTLASNYASTIYRYEVNGTFTTISNLSFSEGEALSAPLIQGTDGNLYGTAGTGGNAQLGCGTIFKLSTSGQMLWTYAFPCGMGGYGPVGPLVQASDGNFYGTAASGGDSANCGAIFKLDQQGTVKTLYPFHYTDGCEPYAGLTQGTDGNLYGTTVLGGKARTGVLFQLSLNGAFKVVYNFGVTGNKPEAAPTQDTNGKFYGTTSVGGRSGFGAVYTLDMGLGPFVTFVQPTAAVGGTAQILGQSLTGATSVTFNGIGATSFKVVNDTYMTAVVPSGATTGPVTISTPGGTLTSNVNFRILQ